MATAVCGRKHTGKSTFLNELAEGYFAKTKKRALIIDVNGSPAYSHHQLLNEKNFKTWCSNDSYGGVKRFYLSDRLKMMLLIKDHFRNGLIVFEDCTKYIKANPQEDIKAFLVDHRMWNVDLMFTFHSIMFVPKFFWAMLTHLVLFKTQDIFLNPNDKSLIQRIPDFQSVYRLHKKIMASKNNYINGQMELL